MKIVIGSGGVPEIGWVTTDINRLDISKEEDWKSLLGEDLKASNLFSEHVWEHIPRDVIQSSTDLCYKYLMDDGRIRIAVPDGNHPDQNYIDHVKPNGIGPGSDDHKILYTYDILKKELESSGFKVVLVEYWDENKEFHRQEWNSEDGHVRRSADHDPRNQDGSLTYTSLIVDGIK
ncbi:MAG: putative methyltransferase [uncultured marine phage]|uniref:Putative methyltransferase n=1 Tax=uncultured marine phage TaxID=707152 RepID=A0A8D9FRX2_9VIRU|nr:MAG: putative methyltransferase [uncultured marine phage]